VHTNIILHHFTELTMADIKRKSELHENNLHKGRYNIKALVQSHPELEQYIIANKVGEKSVTFLIRKL